MQSFLAENAVAEQIARDLGVRFPIRKVKVKLNNKLMNLVTKTIRKAKHENVNSDQNVLELIAHSVTQTIKATKFLNPHKIFRLKTILKDNQENANLGLIAPEQTVLSATLKAKDNSLPNLADRTTKLNKTLLLKNSMSNANKLFPFTNLRADLATHPANESMC